MRFITFEGGEGSGKTTVINRVKEVLEAEGYKVMVTREPGGVKIGEQIRKVLLNKENKEMDYMTEMLLYAAARREHLVHKVRKALEDGYVVLCDRFVDSSLVYQGYVRGLGIEEVWELNKKVMGDLIPVKTLYLDVDPKIGLERIYRDEEREKNRLDLEGMEFHRKVREGYKKIVETFPERIIEVDANRGVEEVVEDVLKEIKKVLK